jgi:hypothetical protein
MDELDGMVISYAKTPGIPTLPAWRSIIMKCSYVPPKFLERFAKRWYRFVKNTGMDQRVDIEMDGVSYCVAVDFLDREPPTNDFFNTIIGALERYCVFSTSRLREEGIVPFITNIEVMDPQSPGWYVHTFDAYNNFVKVWMRRADNIVAIEGVPYRLFKTMVGYDYGRFDEDIE